MDDPKRTFTTLFLIGAAILIIGLFIIWYPDSVISGLKEQINHATLNSQKAALERTLYSENITRITYYQPISIILVTVGSLVITYSIISTLFKLAFKTPKEEKEAELQPIAKDTAITNKEADANSTVKQVEPVPPKADLDFKKKTEDTKRGTKKADSKPITKKDLKSAPPKTEKLEDVKRGTKKAGSKPITKQKLKKTPKKADLDFKKKIEDMKKSLKSDDNSE